MGGRCRDQVVPPPAYPLAYRPGQHLQAPGLSPYRYCQLKAR